MLALLHVQVVPRNKVDGGCWGLGCAKHMFLFRRDRHSARDDIECWSGWWQLYSGCINDSEFFT